MSTARRATHTNLRRTITLYKDDQVHEVPEEFQQRLNRTLRERWRRRFNR